MSADKTPSQLDYATARSATARPSAPLWLAVLSALSAILACPYFVLHAPLYRWFRMLRLDSQQYVTAKVLILVGLPLISLLFNVLVGVRLAASPDGRDAQVLTRCGLFLNLLWLFFICCLFAMSWLIGPIGPGS